MTKLARRNDINARRLAEKKYGASNLRKLMPLLRMAMISVSDAIFDVKKITAINVNR
jgi:hypothetical protein